MVEASTSISFRPRAIEIRQGQRWRGRRHWRILRAYHFHLLRATLAAAFAAYKMPPHREVGRRVSTGSGHWRENPAQERHAQP